MKVYKGKWYWYVRKGDLAVGVGRLPQSLKNQVDLSRPHRGI